MRFFRAWIGLMAVVLLLPAMAAARDDSKDNLVTAETFNRLVTVMKKMLTRIDQLEAQLKQAQSQPLPPGNGSGGADGPARQELIRLRQRVAQLESQLKQGAPAGKGDDGAVNLEDLDKQGPPSSSPAAAKALAGTQPLLKVYFDLDFYSQPGGNSQGAALTFDNFHSFVFLDVTPSDTIRFSTSIQSPPLFYEIDWRFLPKLTLRMGKIWIPFDEMNPHSIYGGLTNVSKIIVGDNFLPDLFTDLGVGLTWLPLDSPDFTLQTDAYVVNGFQEGGNDPVTPGSLYPNFATLPTGPDNNTNKSFGGRAHALIDHFLGVGVSGYEGRWTNQSDQVRNLSMVGADAQLYFTHTTSLRAGGATMSVKLPSTSTNASFLRNGTYVELGQRFGNTDQFTFLLRGGTLDLDNRVVNENNKEILGAKLLWKPNELEFSIEHSHDYKRVPSKGSYDFTNLRVVAAF